MKLSNNSAVPVYTVAGASTTRQLPEWSSQKRKRNLKADPEYASRVELLQDFEFQEASQCVRVSEDGQWVMSTGTYKPQIHTHYLPNLSLSWARHTNALNKKFLILSSDYSKTAHLQEDRSIEFHTPQGCHYSLRIPRYGRDLVYNKASADLAVPAVGVNAEGWGEVFRINLEQGRFMQAYQVDVGGDDLASAGSGTLQGGIHPGSVNTAALAEQSHHLLAFGTSIGTVEYWDPRSRRKAALLRLPSNKDTVGQRPEVTALDFHRSGITMAAGSSLGTISLYDLRSPLPLLEKDHGYGYPIQTLQFLTSSRGSQVGVDEPKVLSADKRIIKLWDERRGSPWTSVEPAVDINSVAWCKDSGLILTANEGKQQHAFFIPQLGPAPKWCAFLDNVVEEMADDPNDPSAYMKHRSGETYENYKFLTTAQLQAINLDHLIGKTNLFRPYMHGYFIKQELYEEARLLANPSSWEEERAKRVKEKIEKERQSRIRGKKQVAAKVNRKMAERILEREEKSDRRRAQRRAAQGIDEEANEGAAPARFGTDSKSLLTDSRFSRLFQDEDYVVDEASHEFQSLNPSSQPGLRSNQDRERGLTAVEEEMIEDVPESNSDAGIGSEDFRGSEELHERQVASATDPVSYRKKAKAKKIQMHATSSNAKVRSRDRSFGSRTPSLKSRKAIGNRAGTVGEKIMSFESRAGMKNARSATDSSKPLSTRARRSASGNALRRAQ